MNKAEQETIVRWDRTDELAYVWTANPQMARELQRKGWTGTQDGHGWRFRLPKRAFRVRSRSALEKPRVARGNVNNLHRRDHATSP